jgi:hypothetical protein
MYHRGALDEFDSWHNPVIITEGLPRTGSVKGLPRPNNQKTEIYSEAIAHPTNQDDYIWQYGSYLDVGKASLSQSEVITEGWFNEEEL